MIFILAIFTVVPLVLTVLNYCEYIDYHTRIAFHHYLSPTLQNSKKTDTMQPTILQIMAFIIIIGIIVQGIFGIAISIIISAIIGIVYGIIKKNRPYILWSSIALAIDVICIIAFILLLMNSNM